MFSEMFSDQLAVRTLPLLAAFVVSLTVAWLLVVSSRWHLRLTDDCQGYLPQKIHLGAVPRIGGAAIVLGVVAGGYTAVSGPDSPLLGPRALGLLLGALLVFMIGLAEDVFKRIQPGYRMLGMVFGALIALHYANIVLLNTRVPAIDALFALYGVAIALTIFGIVGITNAFNIIDGLNGLLGGISLITLTAIAVVAWHLGDMKVELMAGIIAAAMLGFLPFNWPRARLFAGDGGAYFLGFMVAGLLLLLVSRNSAVSPWFGLTATALPLCETLHSIWRRLQLRVATTEPDFGHLHQLVRERVLRGRMLLALREYRATRALPGVDRRARARAPGFRFPNGSVSPWLWGLHASAVALGAALYQNTAAQMLLFAGFILAYRLIYMRLGRSARQRSLIHYDQQTGVLRGVRNGSYMPAPAARARQDAAASLATAPDSSRRRAGRAPAQTDLASTWSSIEPSAERSGPVPNK